jgi:hypothetical protein
VLKMLIKYFEVGLVFYPKSVPKEVLEIEIVVVKI